jgi:hypothetical protein
MGLLRQTLAFQATDPRDKVFALVGLSHGVDPDFIDYKLNMHEVFIRGARFVIRDNAATALQILSLVRGHNRGVLPSWVPDWTESPYGQSPLVSRYQNSIPPSELLQPPSEIKFPRDKMNSCHTDLET